MEQICFPLSTLSFQSNFKTNTPDDIGLEVQDATTEILLLIEQGFHNVQHGTNVPFHFPCRVHLQ